MSATMGVYHLTDNPVEYQPARTNHFRFLVHGLDNLLRADAESNVDYVNNAQEVIDFSVVSFDVPHFKQNSIEVKRGNSRTYFAGDPTFNEGSLKINDFIGADGKSVLEAWQALSYNVINDTIAPSYVYKKDATILEYTSDDKLVRYWDLKGCWVQCLQEDGYDAENSRKKTITATIKYDRAIPHRPSELR